MRYIYDFTQDKYFSIGSKRFTDSDLHSIRFWNGTTFTWQMSEDGSTFTVGGTSEPTEYNIVGSNSYYTIHLLNGNIVVDLFTKYQGQNAHKVYNLDKNNIYYEIKSEPEYYNVDLKVNSNMIPLAPEGYYLSWIRQTSSGATYSYYIKNEYTFDESNINDIKVYENGTLTAEPKLDDSIYYRFSTKAISMNDILVKAHTNKTYFIFDKVNKYYPNYFVEKFRTESFTESDFSNPKLAIINDLSELI